MTERLPMIKLQRTQSQIVYEIIEYKPTVELDTYDAKQCCLLYYCCPRKGLLYMLLGITSLFGMCLTTKLAFKYQLVTPCTAAYCRFLGMVLGNCLYSSRLGVSLWEVDAEVVQPLLFRALTGMVAHLCFIFAFFRLDFWRAVTLNFSSRVFVSLVQDSGRGDCSTLQLLLYTCSMAGIGVLVSPYSGRSDEALWPPLVPLFGSAAMALSHFFVTPATCEVPYLVPSTYIGVCGALILSVLFGLHYDAANTFAAFATPWAALAGAAIGLCGWLGLILQSWALQSESGWRMGVLTFVMIGYGFVFEVVLFGAEIPVLGLLGSGLLVGSNFLYTLREQLCCCLEEPS